MFFKGDEIGLFDQTLVIFDCAARCPHDCEKCDNCFLVHTNWNCLAVCHSCQHIHVHLGNKHISAENHSLSLEVKRECSTRF